MNMNLSPTVKQLLVYLFWIITSVLTVLVLLQLYYAVGAFLAAIGLHRFSARAISQFAISGLGLAALGFIIYVESFYRTSLKKNKLFSRFFQVTFYQAVMLLIAHLIMLISQILVGLPVRLSLIVLAAELAICLLFYWLAGRSKSEKKSNSIP